MNKNIEKIPQDKKDKIINASLKEFALKGYEKASTNSIVKEAGIPKGTLFYFFENKKNLYFYILDYALNELLERFKKENTGFSSDVFERLEQIGLLKLKVALEEPLLYEIAYKSFMNVPDYLKDEIYEKYSRFSARNNSKIFEGIDTSRFKESTDVKIAIEVIDIFLEGYFSRNMDTFKKYPAMEFLKLYKKINNEIKKYFKILKEGVYK